MHSLQRGLRGEQPTATSAAINERTIYPRLTPACSAPDPCRVFLLPNRPGDCIGGALAWATVGGSGDPQVHVQALGEWAIAPFVYMHELGHTLGLEHAGKGDNVYGEFCSHSAQHAWHQTLAGCMLSPLLAAPRTTCISHCWRLLSHCQGRGNRSPALPAATGDDTAAMGGFPPGGGISSGGTDRCHNAPHSWQVSGWMGGWWVSG